MLKRAVGNYIHLTQEPFDGPIKANEYLGWRQPKANQSWDITVEDNFVNRILLGLDLGLAQPTYENACAIRGDKRLEVYQICDINKMTTLQSCLNRNPMGLGKTVEAITTARNLNAKSVLIVVPKIVAGQWRDQIRAWWPERSDDVFVFGATDAKKRKVEQGSIVIVNYEKLLRRRSCLSDRRRSRLPF